MALKRLSSREYIEGILKNNKIILGRAITLVESNLAQDKKISEEIMDALVPYSGNSIRIGITGIPGVGKSTFIEAFGNYVIENANKKVAVLTIDPSSSLSKGSILGDKTRMEKLATNKDAFIRPSPAGITLGGIAARSRETLLLCEAAGYDVVLVETVGVGQSETNVKGMVDIFLLLMLAGTGDDLQGIKRGIIEMADIIAINKADGDNLKNVEHAQKQLKMALQLYPEPESGIPLKVLTCSSLNVTGIDEIWSEIQNYISETKKTGYFQEHRKFQSIKWMHEYISHALKTEFYHRSGIQSKIEKMEKKVMEGKISPLQAGLLLIKGR